MDTAKDLEEPAHQEFETGGTKDQPDEETAQLPDWFQKPAKPPSPDRAWNKTLPDIHRHFQPWLCSLAQMEDLRDLFNDIGVTRQVKTDLMLEEKFRDLCEEVSNFVKESKDVV
nr:hypothetical protein [Tanacetum cinerariifolium]